MASLLGLATFQGEAKRLRATELGENMERGIPRKIRTAGWSIVACLLAITTASGQAAKVEKPQMADDVFKNIQVLRGLTVSEFMGTMGFIASALSMNCSECHDLSGPGDFASDAIPRKQMARRMILMVDMFNKTNFAGKREVTCYSCHRGASRPKVTPSLREQYSAPPDDDPDEVEVSQIPLPGKPTPDQVFDRYIQAVGGADKLNAITSYVAKGTYAGFDTEDAVTPVDIYAKAPNQHSVVVHLLTGGDSVRTFDGTNAWNTSAGTFMPIPVVTLGGGELEGARVDAELSFPGRIKQIFKNWQTNFPLTVIDDNLVDVVQGTESDKTPVKLYFDKKTGLLIRQVRYADTPIGLIPSQVDYEDYRAVAGVKLPYKIVTTWTDGRSTTEIKDVQVNVPIDASKFAKPTGTH
jgi:photosynthetic reaction center cytochrome c subunit